MTINKFPSISIVGATGAVGKICLDILGERKFIKLIIICFIGTTIIWLLLEKVLGIYMRPFPYLIQTLVS